MKAYRQTIRLELTLTAPTTEGVEELRAVVFGELEGREGVRVAEVTR